MAGRLSVTVAWRGGVKYADDLHESKAGVDVEGWEAGLVAVVLGTVVNVGGAGRVVAVAATVATVARCAVLGIEAVPASGPPGSYTSLLLLLLRPPGSYVQLWSLLSVALGLLLSRVSVLSVSMMLVLVLLEGQRELKGGGCGELVGSTSTRPPKSAIAMLASSHVQLACPFQRPASVHQHSTSVMRFALMFGARPP